MASTKKTKKTSKKSAAPLKLVKPAVSALRAALSEDAVEGEYTLLFADGFDDAILGIVRQFSSDPIVCYDRAKCLQVLVDRDGMSYDEADEFFEFNVAGAWVGEETPCFLERPEI